MSPLLFRALGGGLAVLACLGMAALSYAPYQVQRGVGAMVRLAWRARQERIETCRRPTREELEKLPVHMRQQVVCQGVSARYRLRVALDGKPALDEVVRGSGMRHDRPMYLLRDLPLPPGRHDLAVSFERVDSVTPASDEADDSTAAADSALGTPGRSRRETEERRRRRLEAVPAELVLRRAVELAPRQVLVVSYDAERRELFLLEREQR